LAGGVLAVALLVAHAAGQRRVLSPGPLANPHAPLDRRCEDCHLPGHGVAEERCLRCHEPLGSGRLAFRAHVDLATGPPAQPAGPAELRCVDCHLEHLGRDRRLAVTERSQCASCHFGSLASHPEFAVVRTRAAEEPGLRFSHALHVREVGRAKGASGTAACLVCHEPRLEGRDLAPIVFDRHCASCHAATGTLGAVTPLPAEDVAAPESLPPGQGAAEEFDRAAGGIGKRAVRHRDPWVLSSLRHLRRELDPQGYAATVKALADEQARLAGELERAVSAGLALDALTARATAIREQILGLEARARAAARGEGDPEALLREHAARGADLARVEEEIAQRRAGAPPARAVLVSAQQGRLRDQVEALERRRRELGEAPEAGPPLSPEASQRKRAAVDALTAACKKCHVVTDAALAPVRAARPLLAQARFTHRPHLLQIDCEPCHTGADRSPVASDVNLRGIESCRECHRSGGLRQDCQICHAYHPPATASDRGVAFDH
jgi:Cytochrome c3